MDFSTNNIDLRKKVQEGLPVFHQRKLESGTNLENTVINLRQEINKKKQELNSLNNKEGKEIVKNMVNTADLSRSGFMNGDISTVMSPRTVITWAENYLIFKDLEYSFKLSFLNRCDELERPVIEEYYQRSFGIDITDAKVANVKE